MDDDDLLHDAFATDHLWKPSSFFQDASTYESSLFAPLQLDVEAIKLDHPYAPKHGLERELRLPDLESFEFGPLPDLESLDQSSFSIDAPPLEDEDDIWKVALDLGPANKDVQFFSWEGFENPERLELRTPYITESGPEALDAALLRNDKTTPAGRVVKGDVLVESLWNLGLGRSSILFNWDAKRKTFVPTLDDGRASGLSPSSAKSLMNWFILTGSTFVYLRSFVERTFASATSIPARVALATSVSSILTTFEDRLGSHSNTVKSLLQLQQLFARPREILTHVARTVDAVKYAKSNEQLSSILHQRVLEVEEGDDYVRQLSQAILCRVSKPSMELIGEWIGIQKEQVAVPIANRGSFVAVEGDPEEQDKLEYVYQSELMPRFVTPEDGNTVFETGTSLRFLKLHHPTHPLASLEKHGIQPPELEWKFGWEDIDLISAKAKAYEENLRMAILDFGANSPGTAHTMTNDPTLVPVPAHKEILPEEELRKQFEDSAKLFDEAPGRLPTALPDELQLLTTQILDNTISKGSDHSFSPPMSLTSTLSFRPLLTAQAKLVNATTLRLFFRSHQLRTHLSLQRQYHLLGDGVFSSRLASHLFDPERETAERQKGTMRSGVHMGLQLGSRSAWPPASSELRLALMGVLSESYYSSALYQSTTAQSNNFSQPLARTEKSELPGHLNFAIRQLSEPEMEKVMDPDSLHALDFLRLQYIPPSPLHLVISATSLEKYDTIFKFLLRLLRMLFVISHLPREFDLDPKIDIVEARLFRLEASHFINAISMYVFQTGIAEHWERFEGYVGGIEKALAEEDENGELGTRVLSGIEEVRSRHEACLDSIMFSLLLRRRQKKVLALLEEAFECVLAFAKVVRGGEEKSDGAEEGDGADRKEKVRELYASLKGKIRVFISVTRGLTGKRGYGKGRGTGEENTLERLGTLLEMNGYFGG